MPALFTLTAVTGLVDAVSVIGLGRVFVANMTGNVAFPAFALAGDHSFSAPRVAHGSRGVPDRRAHRWPARQPADG